MEDARKCNEGDVVLLPCSGGSNCGQVASQVAASLHVLGKGRLACLAGIGAHIEGVVELARSASRIVAVDGCGTACAKKLIEHAGLTVTDWICVVGRGIEKHQGTLFEQGDVESVTDFAKELLSGPPGATRYLKT